MKLKTRKINETWKQFILENDDGMQVHVLNFGGIITKIIVPDKKGNYENVVLGYEDVRRYEENNSYFGALIGPVAGRITDGRFEIDGKTYELEKNDGTNHLHGGKNGLHRVLWHADPYESANEIGVKLFYHQKEAEHDYPGNVKFQVTYSLNKLNQLMIIYHAETDKKTPITMTNHTYFNLTGNRKDPILNHRVKMNSGYYLELDRELIPTGKVQDVGNSVFDFTSGRILKDGIRSDHEQTELAGNGYDHYFLFPKDMLGSVKVKDEVSGRVLLITTDQPGMVMYTGNKLQEGEILSEGLSEKHLGVCFETQGPPASLNYHTLPSIILNEDEVYHKQTVYSFGVVE